MLDLWLVAALGFLGSFGHCVGMCGALTVAFSLSAKETQEISPKQHWSKSLSKNLYFHTLLNLGRIVSYAIVGAALGAIGSVLAAGGNLAGLDSELRRWLAIATGLLLVWMGIVQINPTLPPIPLLNPMAQAALHQRLSAAMVKLSLNPHPLTPALLGIVWGLIPCGFLYTAQLKAAETSDMWQGMFTMLFFGLGTLPSMLGIGIFSSLLSRDRRSQLFQLGGWITLTIGILTIMRTSDMVDYTGHSSLILLVLALAARPLSQVFKFCLPLKSYRRAIGVGAFVLSLAHCFHKIEHMVQWNLDAFAFMIPQHQISLWLGAIAIALMTPAAITSSDWMVKRLGKYWRPLHLLSVPALIFAAIHTIAIGSSYLGAMEWHLKNWILTGLCSGITLATLILRIIISDRKFQKTV